MSSHSVPETIRYMRQECGLTQAALAEATGLSLSAIRKCETQTDYAVQHDYIKPIADALRLPPEYFLQDKDTLPGLYNFRLTSPLSLDRTALLTIRFPRRLADDEKRDFQHIWARISETSRPLSTTDKAGCLRAALDEFTQAKRLNWSVVDNPVCGEFTL